MIPFRRRPHRFLTNRGPRNHHRCAPETYHPTTCREPALLPHSFAHRARLRLRTLRLLAAAATVAVARGAAAAQVPERFTNLKILPADIRRDSLVNVMRGISLSLNVRCQYCHVGGDGVSFKGVDFAKDDDPDKLKARFMLRMVDSLNGVVLPKLPGLTGRPVKIECKTCHRGGAKPLLLTQELERVRDSAGMGAAIERYRVLREQEGMEGRWDFSEWEMNLWIERLVAAGRTEDAIAAYQLNLEFFPQSGAILTSLGRLHERSDRAKAIDYYERALRLRPEAVDLKQRIETLKAGTPPP